jgi:hypothetical protein
MTMFPAEIPTTSTDNLKPREPPPRQFKPYISKRLKNSGAKETIESPSSASYLSTPHSELNSTPQLLSESQQKKTDNSVSRQAEEAATKALKASNMSASLCSPKTNSIDGNQSVSAQRRHPSSIVQPKAPIFIATRASAGLTPEQIRKSQEEHKRKLMGRKRRYVATAQGPEYSKRPKTSATTRHTSTPWK